MILHRLIYAPAHQRAWEDAKILHRDVSGGNILIDADSDQDYPRGYLSDWDLSKHKDDLQRATQHGQLVSSHLNVVLWTSRSEA